MSTSAADGSFDGDTAGEEAVHLIGTVSRREYENPIIPTRTLSSYVADAFGELFEEDGLLVLGRGLGLLSLLAAFVRFYVDPGEEGYAVMTTEETQGGGSGMVGRGCEGIAKERQSSPVPSREQSVRPRRPPLVFVLGLREAERASLLSTLTAWGTPPELLPIEVTNESGQGKDRSLLYRRGGVFLITSRILIVDLLTGVAAPRDIEGILVSHAESVTEQSTEAFILRIYRTQKRWATHQGAVSPANPFVSSNGFVKAFSDNPDALVAGFAKVDKILKALYVRRLYLYPRFHDSVASELEKSPPHVTELHQQLTPKMKEIQNAIAAAVQTCIRELKKSTSLIQWTESDLTLENCVTTNFELSISRQLEHDWHRLKPQTKQMVNDLRTLRTLFQYLVQYDCVAFWRLINSIRTMSAAARNPSLWLLTPAADLLFRKAKERLYKIEKPRPTREIPEPIARLKPVLEENPKWRLLREVLTEVWKEWSERGKRKHGKVAGSAEKGHVEDTAGGAQVLIVVKDEKTLDTIKSYLVDGRERTMALRWLRYLEQQNDRSRAVAKSAAAATHGDGASSGSTRNGATLTEEGRLLLEEEGRIRNFLFGPKTPKKAKKDGPAMEHDETEKGEKRVLGAMPDWKRKRRRIAKEIGRGERTLQSDDLERRAVLDEALEEIEQNMTLDTTAKGEKVSERVKAGEREFSEDGYISSEDEDELPYKVHSFNDENDLRLVIRTHASVEGDQALSVLYDTKPDFVVLYDAEPSFVRSLEIYAATTTAGADISAEEAEILPNHDRLRVFFMLFEASSEEKNFLKAIEREQNAFERLIQHKKSMPLPVITIGGTTQEMQAAMGGVGGSYAGGTLPLSVDSRTGRGKQKTDKERRDIAVDVREFRSALPSILHQGGMRIAPVTLTVGDFVLSNVHCVERKSISDLFGSFASGRLYTQAESMSKHYKCPCLLIEFDPAKSFCLQNSNELGADIKTDSVCSKMALLTMHFPRLRVLWSRSPHETLKVFKALKTSHDEVDVDRAVEVGSNESLDALLAGSQVEDDDGEIDEVNEAARDMLLRLPGVNVHNARKIMNVCDSIAELADMPREELKELLGPITGQKLFTFFRLKLAST